MDTTTLGRTGLKVSVMGMGCGGPSRLGTLTGRTEEEAVAVVRHALDLGINLVDTAELYGTEAIVGRAIRGRDRDAVVLSTKGRVFLDGVGVDPAGVRANLESSLGLLGTDAVDLYHAHLVLPDQYAHVREHIVPVLLKLRDEGKIRFLGITESFLDDPRHAMLRRALEDDCWDVVMAGFNLLNPSARARVFPMAREKGVGFLNMIAFRQAFGEPGYVRERLAGKSWMGDDPPLGFLTRDPDVGSLAEAAYRFCRWEEGVDVVLSGTGNLAHLDANAASVGKPPLAPEHLERLQALFEVTGVRPY